jgi:hypothetical protein
MFILFRFLNKKVLYLQNGKLKFKNLCDLVFYDSLIRESFNFFWFAFSYFIFVLFYLVLLNMNYILICLIIDGSFH